MRWARSNSTSDGGFTLVEVLVAMLIMAIASLGVAALFAVSIRANQAARFQTSTTTLATQKMEQLRGLTWGFDADGLGLPVSDTTTNLSVYPPDASGGGLNPSPNDALNVNSAGFVDYLDARGTWVGNGATPPASAVYIRRWSIQPLPTNPNNTLILQVLVTTVRREAQVTGETPRKRHADDALIATVKTRKGK
ncbi:MAG TPA: prepilin-type N-terminal cleavage/methylation domain-containing protein [Vicinamibacterales bacterium]|nr:prepilin-type N-terminal cleavage/methylation domain-containing protein [Vicinamibacterales bacterium]